MQIRCARSVGSGCLVVPCTNKTQSTHCIRACRRRGSSGSTCRCASGAVREPRRRDPSSPRTRYSSCGFEVALRIVPSTVFASAGGRAGWVAWGVPRHVLQASVPGVAAPFARARWRRLAPRTARAPRRRPGRGRRARRRPPARSTAGAAPPGSRRGTAGPSSTPRARTSS